MEILGTQYRLNGGKVEIVLDLNGKIHSSLIGIITHSYISGRRQILSRNLVFFYF